MLQLPRFPFALLIAVTILTWALLSLPPQRWDTENYAMAFYDKKRKLETLPSPRIMIVGGSNAVFGYDSKLIKDELKIDVINSGLYIGLGLRYMLTSMKKYLKKGDLVIISPEYEHFYGMLDGNDDLVDFLLNYPDALSEITIEQLPALIKGARSLIIRKFSHLIFADMVPRIFHFPKSALPPGQEAYEYSAFNSYGDIGTFLDKPALTPDKLYLPLYINESGNYDQRTIYVLNDFADYAKQHDVKVMFVFPGISSNFYDACSKSMETLYLKLKASLKMPILFSPRQCTMPATWFYDTRYHPLTSAKRLHTKMLIHPLSKILER